MTDYQLPADMTRCLAHANEAGQFWDCAPQCERHQQIARDHRPSENVVMNACSFNRKLPLRIPIGGFPQDDTQ